MNQQLIASQNSLFLPWANAVSQPSPTLTQNVSSQGYPPNVSASIVTASWPSTLESVKEPITISLKFGEAMNFFRDEVSYHQIPFVNEEARISPIRSSDLIVHDLDELMVGKEDEVKPTVFAYTYARRIIESAFGRMQARNVPTLLPNPVATTDDLGGIRLLWNLGPRNVRLNFGAAADRQSYLYHEAGLEHDVEPLNDETVFKRLAWLTAR